MKQMNFDGIEKKVSLLKKRCPWVSTLLLHCLKTRSPQAFDALRLILARLKLTVV